MIKLYGHPGSTCTRKVLTALAETETPYELHVVDLSRGEHKQEPHLTRQPFGQIPVLDDGSFRLYESRAICRYLSAKAGDKLTPSNLQQRARMDQWLSVEQSNFSPNAMKFVYHHVLKRPQEESVLESAKQMLEKSYGILGNALAEQPFLAGEQFTLADIGYMPYIEYLQLTPVAELMSKFPTVVAWWQRVSSRPSWQKAIGKA